MRALRFHRQGPPDVLQIDELDAPVPGPGQVAIRVRAVGVNHLDVWVRRELPRIPLPRVTGADAAGEVTALGPGARGVQVGDRVLLDPGRSCGLCARCAAGEPSLCLHYGIVGESMDGVAAESVVVPDAACVAVPVGWGWAEAAAFPLVAMTAWRMLRVRGRLQEGEAVLIHGAAAGVGVMAVQIARAAGCRVVATASTPGKRALVEALGAHVVLDALDPDLPAALRREAKAGFDVVVDYVGQATWGLSLRALRPGGRLLTCGATTGAAPPADLRHIFFRQLEILGSTMGSRADLLAALALAARGGLRVPVADVLPLADGAEAHRRLEARDVAGKLVLEIP